MNHQQLHRRKTILSQKSQKKNALKTESMNPQVIFTILPTGSTKKWNSLKSNEISGKNIDSPKTKCFWAIFFVLKS